MKTTFKKLLVVAMGTAMMFSAMSVGVFAEEGTLAPEDYKVSSNLHVNTGFF